MVCFFFCFDSRTILHKALIWNMMWTSFVYRSALFFALCFAHSSTTKPIKINLKSIRCHELDPLEGVYATDHVHCEKNNYPGSLALLYVMAVRLYVKTSNGNHMRIGLWVAFVARCVWKTGWICCIWCGVLLGCNMLSACECKICGCICRAHVSLIY